MVDQRVCSIALQNNQYKQILLTSGSLLLCLNVP
jgi:hypothetical protein